MNKKKIDEFDFFGKPKINSMELTKEERLRAFDIITNPPPMPKDLEERIKNRFDILKNLK
jgi:hypothetical protein